MWDADYLIMECYVDMVELIIAPYGDVSDVVLQHLAEDLALQGYAVYRHEPLPLMMKAYNYERRQYRADVLLNGLKDLRGERVLGVINADIYVYVLDYIKGFADLPGRMALISLARLQSQPELLRGRAEKLAMHELGHTCGLEHCLNPVCVMHAATEMSDIDLSGPAICPLCQSVQRERQAHYAKLFSPVV